jgi:hypothetical protein
VSKGYLIFAQNSNVDYVRQAIALSASLKAHGNLDPVSIVTDDLIPERYLHLFDKVISIPWGDSSKRSTWKVENRWKLYHVSPYTETIVFDSDVLVTENLDNAWSFLLNSDLFFTSQVYDFKARLITDTVYRKTFIENNLPNVYFGFHYFKKSEIAHSFYQQLEAVVKDYQYYYNTFTPKYTQEFLSMDVSSAIAVKLLQIEHLVTCKIVEPTKFIHMKPAIQSLDTAVAEWSKVLDTEVDQTVIVGNRPQRGIFHYVSDDFLTTEIFNRICQHAVA